MVEKAWKSSTSIKQASVVIPLADGGQLVIPLAHIEDILEELADHDAEHLQEIVRVLRSKGL